MLGRHTLKGWSKTQFLIALSSGEFELYASLKASAEALGLVSLLQDLGYSESQSMQALMRCGRNVAGPRTGKPAGRSVPR